MPLYSYKALAGGKSVRGEIVADSERHARTLLRESGVAPITLEERTEARRRAPSIVWMAAFSRQLGTLLRAGFPMDKALSAMAVSAGDPSSAAAATSIADGVSRGQKLSEAVGRAVPGGGADELRSIVEAGEASGDLPAVLANYAELLDRRLLFRRRMRGALFYPLMVAGIAVAVVAFLFAYVVPTITKLFEGTDMTLPIPTRILFFLSDMVQIGTLPGIIALVFAFYALRNMWRSESGRLRIEIFVHRLPLFGGILLKAAIARWARTFGSLLGNGVDILTALDIAAKASNSARIRGAIGTARPRVAQGVPVARAIAETRIFPALAIEAVSIGEASGALPQLLGEMAAGWESEVEASAERFADFLEPAMLVVMGLTVGFIVLAILLPIFEFNAGVK